MNKMILAVLLISSCGAIARPVNRTSEPRMQAADPYAAALKQVPLSDTGIILNSEDDIKARLILLAYNNAQAVAADGSIHIAEIARRKANSSFLSSINIGGNVNEFVINNSPAANFFPKYNFGLFIPLDMFARARAEKRTADEMIIISKAQKALVNEGLKARVLIKYEVYKEKKELLELQRINTGDDLADYEKAQKDYKDDVITIEDVNRVYKAYITSKGNLASKVKDLNIAVLEIEEIIGVPLRTVLEKRLN